MSRIILAVMAVLVFALPSFAATSTRDALQKIGDWSHVGNGWSRVDRYDVSTFNVGAAVNQMKSQFTDYTRCGFDTVVGVHRGVKEIMTVVTEDDGPNVAKIEKMLNRLAEAGLIKIIIGKFNNGEGEPENCLLSAFEIYTTDGYVLSLHFDYTD